MWSFLSDKEKLILLSGIFEGEGCCGYYRAGNSRNIELAVAMTDEDVILKFKEFFKVGFTGRLNRLKKSHHKICYRWKVTGVEALKVMHLMLPYLGKRRIQNYYGMVQSIRDGSKNWSAYILQPTKDQTSNVGRSTQSGRGNGARRERVRR